MSKEEELRLYSYTIIESGICPAIQGVLDSDKANCEKVETIKMLIATYEKYMTPPNDIA